MRRKISAAFVDAFAFGAAVIVAYEYGKVVERNRLARRLTSINRQTKKEMRKNA